MKKGLLIVLSICCISMAYAQDELKAVIHEAHKSKVGHRFDFTIQDVNRDEGGGDLIGGLSIAYVIDYKYHNAFRIGVGVGYQRLSRVEYASVPLFINIGGDILDRVVTPYYNLKGGKLFFPGKTGTEWFDVDYQSTWILHPEIGLRITPRARVGIGYRINRYVEHIVYSENNIVDRDIKTKRWTLSYSISF